jgi:hypothetical protein
MTLSQAMATADGRLEFFRSHAGCAATSVRSGLAPKPRDYADASRGDSVGMKSFTLDAMQSPQHSAFMGVRDSHSFGGGVQRGAHYSPAMSSVSTVDLDSVAAPPRRPLPEGFRQAPLVNNFMSGAGADSLGLVVSRRLQVAKRQ